MRISLFCLAGVFLLIGCTVPIRVRPIERPLLSSETSGRPFKPSIGARLGTRPGIELTPDLTNTAPSTRLPDISLVEDLTVNSEIAVARSIDVGIDLSFYELLLRGKFQFLGFPTTSASSGNFSLAAIGGLGVGTMDYKNSDSVSSPRYTLHTYSLEAGLVAGIRPVDWLLPFLGVSAKYDGFDGTFTANAATVGSGNYSGQAFWWGPYTGVEFGRERFRYRFTAGLSTVISGDVRKDLFSTQGELRILLGSMDK